MNMKKKVMRRIATLLIASLALTGTAFSVLAASAARATRANEDIYDLVQKENVYEVKVGETITLNAETETVATNSDAAQKATNSNALRNNMKWSVDGSEIAKIEGSGLSCKVTGVKAGEATVTAVSSKGDFSSTEITFKVTVIDGTSTDPTDPSKPTDPTDPSEPTDPSNPTDPSEPTDPEAPSVEKVPVKSDSAIAEELKGLDGLDVDVKDPEQLKEAIQAVKDSTDMVNAALGELVNTIVETLKEETQKLADTFSQITNAISALRGRELSLNVSKAKPMETKIVVKNGKPMVVIPKMSYNINLIDQNKGLVSHNDMRNNTTPIEFDIPLPAEGIHEDWKWAVVTHRGSNGHTSKFKSPIRDDGKGNRVVGIKAWSFSEFEFEFFENEEDIPQEIKSIDNYTLADANPNANTNSGSSSSGGGGSRSRVSSEVGSNASQNRYAMTGNWTSDANGWKFVKSNGETAANTWGWINNQYYYFDAAGKMVTGWTQVDGKWYYLNPTGTLQGAMLTGVIFDQASNAYFYTDASGAMVTGWQQINEKWYYFSPVSDGVYKLGQLLAGTYIDGYYLGADGAMVPAN